MIRVEKWHGAGNDFLVIDARDGTESDWSGWAPMVCDRHRGVGADGLLVLEADPELNFAMRYWNADGSVASMCGNGGRVIAAYAARRDGLTGEIQFRSTWGPHTALVTGHDGDRWEIDLALPDVPPPVACAIDAPWGRSRAVRVRPGVPHLVVDREATPAATLREVPLAEWGGRLRSLPELGEEGANVDFVERRGPSRLALRTFERGVEGETLACGTGATAAAVAAGHWGWGPSPWSVEAWSGDEIQVSFELDDAGVRSVRLRGPAVRVFETELPQPEFTT